MTRYKVRADILFWAIAFCSILPFIILAFFSHPGAEDYLFELFRKNDFWHNQQLAYHGWSGRFFTNLFNTAWAQLGFIFNCYFLHTLLLFICTEIAAFYFLFNANTILTNGYFSKSKVLQASFILLLLNIYLLADIPSNFYWFSAVFVYQVPVILLYILAVLFLKRFKEDSQRKSVKNIFIVTTILLLIGCNETIATAIIVLLFFAAVFTYWRNIAEKKIILRWFLIALTAGIIVFISSGVLLRQKLMNAHTGYAVIFPIIVFRTFMVFYTIFKEPVFWVSLCFCFFAGGINAAQEHAKTKIALLILWAQKKIYYSLAFIAILVFAILTPLLIVSKGTFPDRALNNIILIAAMYLLMTAFIAGHSTPPAVIAFVKNTISNYALTFAIGAAMVLNTGYINAWKSVCSGYFYHKIMQDRDAQLENAKSKNYKIINMLSYKDALHQKIKEHFPNGSFKSLTKALEQPPVTIPFFNEAEDSTQLPYLSPYGVEKIIIYPSKP